MNNQQIYYPDTTHLGLPTADQVRGASRGVNGPDWQSQTCRVVAPMLPVASTPRFLPPKGFPFFSTSKLMTPGPALDLHNRSRAPPVFLQVFSSPPQKKDQTNHSVEATGLPASSVRRVAHRSVQTTCHRASLRPRMADTPGVSRATRRATRSSGADGTGSSRPGRVAGSEHWLVLSQVG